MEKIPSFIVTAFEFTLNILGDTFNAIIDAFEKQKGFNAKFGSERDISSRWNKGFLISKHRRLTRKKSFENLLLCSQTGGGKTSKIISKNLFELKNCSLVVNDPSKELFNLTSGYLNQFFNIKTLNFSDASVSSGYNILSRIKQTNDINKLAHLLVSSSLDRGGNSDPFWSIQSKTILQIFIRLIMHQPEEYRHMAGVKWILDNFSANPKKVDNWIVKTKDEKLILDYKSIIATPEKTLQSIVASAKSAIQIFEDDMIAKITAHDSINFDELRQKPTIIFLHNSVSDQRYLSVLTGIFFEQLFNHILKKLPEKELDLFIVLEETASIYIPLLPLFLANNRKHRVGNLICLQTLSGQLKNLYKEDSENIIANCITKIFLAGQTEISVLRDLETLGGKATYIDDKKMERIKPLISADEIRLLRDNRTLIVSGNNPIIKGRVSPYFKSHKYKSYSKIPPIALIGDIPDEPISLMQ